jgi:2-amino-4-hydroxy-6-hydroxymethyldihydropteridine diphosphokinase
LLALLHRIEVIFGRVRGERWGKRILDADLIAFGTQVLPDFYTYEKWRDLPISDQMLQTPDQLILPHPRLQDRAFVLRPLMDLVPDWVHPVSSLKIREIYAQLPAKDRAEVKLILERA